MRDYPNGGFFFIDAAPIIAAGESGLKIDGISEDAKRAIKGGKVVVISNFPEDEGILQGAMIGSMLYKIDDDLIMVTVEGNNIFAINEDIIYSQG